MNEHESYPASLLLNALSDGLPLPDILTIAAGLVRNPVLFDDVTDRIVATSKDMDLDRFYMRPVSGDEKFVPSDMIERSRRDGLSERLRESPEPIKTYDPLLECHWIIAYVVVNGAIVGNVLTREVEYELTEEDRLVMGTLAWVVSLFLQCKGENEELPMSEMYFLYNLLNNNPVSEKNLPKWLDHMDWRPSDEMCVAVIKSLSRGTEDIEWSYYAEMLNRYNPDSIMCTYKNDIVLLQSHGSMTLSKESMENYEYMLYSAGLVAGYSRSVSQLNDVYKAYRQASNAIELGLKRSERENTEKAMFFYGDYVLDQMVAVCARDEETMYALCHPALFRLVKYDKEHGTEFYRTLETFFRLGNNLAKLSEEMKIHRNTAYYRMNKIFQITGIDLRGDPSVLRLQFSFALMEGRNISDSYLFV